MPLALLPLGAPPIDHLGALTSLVGRETEIATARKLLSGAVTLNGAASAVRLLTLTGPGGVGKTRLADAVAGSLAHDYPDGVAWVDLAAVKTPAAVASTIAWSLGLREEGSRSPFERVRDAIGDRRILLILDNFEHLLEAAPPLVNLLRACSRLRILVTSRERLHVNGEFEQPVAPLPLPSATASAEEALATPAVRLFIERALAVAPALSPEGEAALIVADICRRLDGLPLAIELAAARIKILPPVDLLDRLDERLPLLSDGPRDAPPRLRTMRDAITWSYELLTPEEQHLFRRLAIFVDGFTLEAAKAVGTGHEADDERLGGNSGATRPSEFDLVAALVEKSLLIVRHATSNGTRYAMLETIREFALERLAASGEYEDAARSHAAFALRLAERIEPELYGGPHLKQCIASLEAEYGNLSAALTWLKGCGEGTLALQLATSLLRFWLILGRNDEGQTWLERSVAEASRASSSQRARAYSGIAVLAWPRHSRAQALEALGQAEALVEAGQDLAALAFARLSRGWIALDQGDVAVASRVAAEAKDLYERLGHRADALLSAQCLARAVLAQGDLKRADALYSELIAASNEIGDDYGIATAQHGLGLLRTAQGEYLQALALQARALRGYHMLGGRLWVADCLQAAAGAAAVLGQAERAAFLLGAEETVRTETGLPTRYVDQNAFHETASSIRTLLGESAFTEAWQRGASATLDDVVTAVHVMVQDDAVVHRPDGDVAPFGLSPREIEVLRLMAEGQTDQETAGTLSVSRRTVHTHVTSILNKLTVQNRTAAVAAAVRLGLV